MHSEATEARPFPSTPVLREKGGGKEQAHHDDTAAARQDNTGTTWWIGPLPSTGETVPGAPFSEPPPREKVICGKGGYMSLDPEKFPRITSL